MTASAEARDWIDDLRAFNVAEVGATFGLAVDRSGRALRPCPVCGAEQRGSSDRRSPIGTTPDAAGWRCHRCGAGGDAVSLAAAVVTGETRPARERWRDIRAQCAVAGLCDSEPWQTPNPALVRRPPPRTEPPASPARSHPPIAEVCALWSACRAATEDPEVCSWIESRGLDPQRVVDLDLVRALPRDSERPWWAWCRGRAWAEGGWRAVVALVDAHGQVASVRARHVSGGAPKSVAPAGYSVTGLLAAEPLARQLLARAALPEWWPPSVPLRVVVAEGEPDWLAWATRWSEAVECAPAVFGIEVGAWTAAIAARIPIGTRVIVRTHHDGPGERYAKTIAATLAGRAEVLRGGANEAA